jgi:hypothetical protein
MVWITRRQTEQLIDNISDCNLNGTEARRTTIKHSSANLFLTLLHSGSGRRRSDDNNTTRTAGRYM